MLPKKPKLPPGITMRNGQYRVRVSYEFKQYDCGQYESLTVAKAALQQARIDIATRQFIPPAERRRQLKERLEAERASDVTVQAWYEIWIKQLENDPLHPRSPATIVSYKSTYRTWISPAIGEKRLTEVTPEDVDALVDAAAASGPGAANNAVRHLRSMMNAAVIARAGGLKESPVKVTPGKAGTRKRTDDEVPTVDELNAIAAKMPERLRLAPELAVWAALRVGEVLGLQRGDFRNLNDPEKAEVRILRQWNVKGHTYSAPKDDSAGTVPLPAFILPAVREHLDKYVLDATDAPVFPSVQDRARPVSYNALHGAWKDAREGARYPFSLHSWRHRGLTEFAKTGATNAEIMRHGRHKDATASARYQHSSAERHRTLTAKLNAMQSKDEK